MTAFWPAIDIRSSKMAMDHSTFRPMISSMGNPKHGAIGGGDSGLWSRLDWTMLVERTQVGVAQVPWEAEALRQYIYIATYCLHIHHIHRYEYNITMYIIYIYTYINTSFCLSLYIYIWVLNIIWVYLKMVDTSIVLSKNAIMIRIQWVFRYLIVRQIPYSQQRSPGTPVPLNLLSDLRWQ